MRLGTEDLVDVLKAYQFVAGIRHCTFLPDALQAYQRAVDPTTALLPDWSPAPWRETLWTARRLGLTLVEG